MEKINPLMHGVGRTLALQVSKGFFTLEDLDTPSPGYQAIERDRQASQNPCDWSDPSQKRRHVCPDGEDYWSFPRPTIKYPPAKPFRNLAREWIAANPKEWEAMNGRPVVSVSVVPDPKDFDTVLPPSDTPTYAPKLPLTLDEEEGPAPIHAGGKAHAADEHPDQPDELQAASGFEALPW